MDANPTPAERAERLRALLTGVLAADPDRFDSTVCWRESPDGDVSDAELAAAGSRVVACAAGWACAHADVVALGLSWDDDLSEPVFDGVDSWHALQAFAGLSWGETLALFDDDELDDEDRGFFNDYVRGDDAAHDGDPKGRYVARLRRAVRLAELAVTTRPTLSSRP
jgi:hypothetical protein